MSPQDMAKKAMEDEIAAAGLDKEEQQLLQKYANYLTGAALILMERDARKGVEVAKPLRAMISACKVCLVGLEHQRMDFAGGD